MRLSLPRDPGNEFVGAIGAVGEQKILCFDMLEKAWRDADIVPARIAGHKAFPTTMAEVDHAVDAHDGKAAALLLTGGLGEEILIGLGIHELHRTAVDGLEGKAVPLVDGTDALSHPVGDPVGNLSKEVLAELHPGHAIAGGASAGHGESAGLIPRLDQAQSFAAGGVRFKDLSQPCPKYREVAKAALASGWIDGLEEARCKDRFKEKGVAADRISDDTFTLRTKCSLNLTSRSGKNAQRKAGQEWFFFHTF